MDSTNNFGTERGGITISPQSKVVVEWTDSNITDSQTSQAYPFCVAHITTVGTLIKYLDGGIVLARDCLRDHNFDETEYDVRGTLVIPHENLVTIKELITVERHRTILNERAAMRILEQEGTNPASQPNQ